MIQKERISKLNENPIKKGDYVLYWMQASPRSHYNHALEYGIKKANDLKKPLLVYFGLTHDYPESNKRHLNFLLEGLKHTQLALESRGIKMAVQLISPPEGAIDLAGNASLVILDRGYLKIQKKWVQEFLKNINCSVIQVETNTVVPVETASFKEEYSAATIRRKIHNRLKEFLVPLEMNDIIKSSLAIDESSISLEDSEWIFKKLGIKSRVKPVKKFKGGTENAFKFLDEFMKKKLDKFEYRNDPGRDYLSHMSPYLHFGQISPLFIALRVLSVNSPGKSSYLEELIIRRELALNFVFYNEHYDQLICLPGWAKKTLDVHEKDQREYNYTFEEFANAQTHDPYWNAAQTEMVATGKMHGYMRMYWGKKIIEWVESPETAYKIAIKLNNMYELDGRDPNGYAGVAWCFGKHDRAWKERDIFGKVRYMNAKGLERKFKINRYVSTVEDMV